MSDKPMYHEGMRALQDAFDARRIADRLEQVTVRDAFDEGHRQLIARSLFFLLATADAEGWPDCSYKGGAPGFVRVLDERTLAFPSFDGNGMFRSLGNLRVNPRLGMLFIDLERPKRLRVNGRATVHAEDPLLAEYPGAQLIVRVHAERIFPNCPRYIHHWALQELSAYTPQAGCEPPVPEWKQRPEFRDALPGHDPAGGAGPADES
jgi:uncharacterized protein